jgi:hypothetical protein
VSCPSNYTGRKRASELVRLVGKLGTGSELEIKSEMDKSQNG